jgi:hypothetical protein
VHPFRFQLRNQAIFFAFKVQSLGRNLFEMNLHLRILSQFIL